LVQGIVFKIASPDAARPPARRFTEWCDAVVSRLARHALGSIEVLGLNTLEELVLAMIRTESS
jgi:hypothetical protein